MDQFIEYTDEARTHKKKFRASDCPLSLILDDDGGIGTDTIPVFLVGMDGIRKTSYTVGGIAFSFSAEDKTLAIYAPCTILIEKPATTNSVGIGIASNQ